MERVRKLPEEFFDDIFIAGWWCPHSDKKFKTISSPKREKPSWWPSETWWPVLAYKSKQRERLTSTYQGFLTTPRKKKNFFKVLYNIVTGRKCMEAFMLCYSYRKSNGDFNTYASLNAEYNTLFYCTVISTRHQKFVQVFSKRSPGLYKWP